MIKEDIDILERLLTTYSNEEFAATVADLCHGMKNTEINNIICCLQRELEAREIK